MSISHIPTWEQWYRKYRTTPVGVCEVYLPHNFKLHTSLEEVEMEDKSKVISTPYGSRVRKYIPEGVTSHTLPLDLTKIFK